MKLLVSAIEPSSNVHLTELLKHMEGVKLLGVYDASLSESKPLYDISQMAIMGVVDAIKKIRWFYKVANELVEEAKDADKILLMDGSGFNLPLAKKLKKTYPNKEIIYYILPQVWASRAYRVKKLEKYCDKLLGILPFEIDYYTKATYVGHPLLDEIEYSFTNQKGIISFMPGSRKGEVTRLMPIFRELRAKLSDKKAVLIVPKSFSQEKIQQWYGYIDGFEISHATHKSLSESEFAFICSGTATLEAALIGTPFTLAYIAKKIDYFIGTKIFGIKQIGLANIFLSHYNGTKLHNELLQEDVTVANLLNEYHNTNQKDFSKKAQELREYLACGSSKNVAKIIKDI
jgi:lipid-A-disaccharide synthase